MYCVDCLDGLARTRRTRPQVVREIITELEKLADIVRELDDDLLRECSVGYEMRDGISPLRAALDALVWAPSEVQQFWEMTEYWEDEHATFTGEPTCRSCDAPLPVEA